MAIALIIIAVGILALTFRTIARDGYGSAPTPRSREPWTAGGLPSEPYRIASR